MARNRTTGRVGRSWQSGAAVIVVVVFCTLAGALVTQADHESTNQLTFAPAAGGGPPGAAGTGTIEYHGGLEPVSRWTSTFEFSGLEPATAYVVMVMGRTGADGSAAASAFSPICPLTSDADGNGYCWDYGLGMQRIGVVQLRQDSDTGPVVLQAAREPGGPGEIDSVPNAFTPRPTVPAASPPPLLGSPIPE